MISSNFQVLTLAAPLVARGHHLDRESRFESSKAQAHLRCKRPATCSPTDMASLAAFLMVLGAVTLCVEGQVGRHVASRKLQAQIGHGCGNVACIDVYYDTAYATCESEGDTHLPAYINCCVLRSCEPRSSTGCILHLNNGEDMSCGF
ncbi:hypothetical protein GOP47_0013798 [Adiantum capillus-veneris]|uniref:Uncharacterized protein n=1 Tax=Adiantum capillus-veneris TaxID=13818 RepID=A0A9D4UQ62_ADICA|nr:hypothetical protein GOP47_0013798 [Adiantum capillus-veneris]